jgi:hypothetical protein
MNPVQIDWSRAKVSTAEGDYALEVPFQETASAPWWDAFVSSIETRSREVTGARWHTIRGIGDPAQGLYVDGIGDGSVEPLRRLLDLSVKNANKELQRSEKGRTALRDKRREQIGRAAETAERLTQAFRRGF